MYAAFYCISMLQKQKSGLKIEREHRYLTHFPVSFAIPWVKSSTLENQCSALPDWASKFGAYFSGESKDEMVAFVHDSCAHFVISSG